VKRLLFSHNIHVQSKKEYEVESMDKVVIGLVVTLVLIGGVVGCLTYLDPGIYTSKSESKVTETSTSPVTETKTNTEINTEVDNKENPTTQVCTKCAGDGIRVCLKCGGTGKIKHIETCATCGGDGKIPVGAQGFQIFCEDPQTKDCSDCGGDGKNTVWETCPGCGGDGKVSCTYCGGDGYV